MWRCEDVNLHPVAFNTVMDQFGDVMGGSFLHAVALVILDCMNTQVQLLCDHFAAHAFMTEFDNLQFTLR